MVLMAGDHPIYGHIRCIYTVMANPSYICACTHTRLCLTVDSCVHEFELLLLYVCAHGLHMCRPACTSLCTLCACVLVTTLFCGCT